MRLLDQIDNKEVQQPTFSNYTFADLMQVKNDYIADPVLYFSSGMPIRSCISDKSSIVQLISFCIMYRLCMHFDSRLVLIEKLLSRRHPLSMFDHNGDKRLNAYNIALADKCEADGYFGVVSSLRVKSEYDFRKVKNTLFGVGFETTGWNMI